ncbi:MAG: hypothetical protein AB1576_00165 [Bacillota bacterium]|jgi:heme/copper-type cytochrome/quinol oxidase subunit 2
MGTADWDFKDYLTVGGVAFIFLVVMFFFAWFIYDLRTKVLDKKGHAAPVQDPSIDQGATWFDRELFILAFLGPFFWYGVYFILYWSCRVYNQPFIGVAYWCLIGIYGVLFIIYITVSEWQHVETVYDQPSFYQAIFGHPLTERLRRANNKASHEEGGGQP